MNQQSLRSSRLRPVSSGSPRAVWRVAAVMAVWCCALAMQTIGLMHAQVHAHRSMGSAPAHVHAHGAPGGHPTLLEGQAPGADTQPLLQALFGGHEADSNACHLFDQVTHADQIPVAMSVGLPPVAPGHPDAVHAAWHHATQSVGFLARGPPAAG